MLYFLADSKAINNFYGKISHKTHQSKTIHEKIIF